MPFSDEMNYSSHGIFKGTYYRKQTKSKVLHQNVQVNEAVASTTSSQTWVLMNCLQPGDSRLS